MMDYKPSSTTQVQVLWMMLFLEEEPMISGIRPELKPGLRQELIDAGLVRLKKSEKAYHLALTGRGREWVLSNLDLKVTPRPYVSTVLLHAVFSKLKAFLQANGYTLDDFLRAEGPAAESVPRPAADKIVSISDIADDTELRVRAAYFELSGGTWNEWVRLADLRDRLADLTHEELDVVLLSMQQEDKLMLSFLTDPFGIEPEDEEAAVNISGKKFHILMMER